MRVSDADRIANAYRWQRALGHRVVETEFCRIIATPSRPDVWDANYADGIIASAPHEIDALMASLDDQFAHSRWRVVHGDSATSDAVLARLAFEGFREQSPTIQMRLNWSDVASSSANLHPVVSCEDWDAVLALAFEDHEEGLRTGGHDLSNDVTRGIVQGYMDKSDHYRFHLVLDEHDTPVGYGAYVLCPDNVGMIEDLFVLPSRRGFGLASAMIARFVVALGEAGADLTFIGAIEGQRARHLYARLGFVPVSLSRCWVKGI